MYIQIYIYRPSQKWRKVVVEVTNGNRKRLSVHEVPQTPPTVQRSPSHPSLPSLRQAYPGHQQHLHSHTRHILRPDNGNWSPESCKSDYFGNKSRNFDIIREPSPALSPVLTLPIVQGECIVLEGAGSPNSPYSPTLRTPPSPYRTKWEIIVPAETKNANIKHTDGFGLQLNKSRC